MSVGFGGPHASTGPVVRAACSRNAAAVAEAARMEDEKVEKGTARENKNEIDKDLHSRGSGLGHEPSLFSGRYTAGAWLDQGTGQG